MWFHRPNSSLHHYEFANAFASWFPGVSVHLSAFRHCGTSPYERLWIIHSSVGVTHIAFYCCGEVPRLRRRDHIDSMEPVARLALDHSAYETDAPLSVLYRHWCSPRTSMWSLRRDIAPSSPSYQDGASLLMLQRHLEQVSRAFLRRSPACWRRVTAFKP